MASSKAKFFVGVIFGIFIPFFAHFFAKKNKNGAIFQPAKILRVSPAPQTGGTPPPLEALHLAVKCWGVKLDGGPPPPVHTLWSQYINIFSKTIFLKAHI